MQIIHYPHHRRLSLARVRLSLNRPGRIMIGKILFRCFFAYQLHNFRCCLAEWHAKKKPRTGLELNFSFLDTFFRSLESIFKHNRSTRAWLMNYLSHIFWLPAVTRFRTIFLRCPKAVALNDYWNGQRTRLERNRRTAENTVKNTSRTFFNQLTTARAKPQRATRY